MERCPEPRHQASTLLFLPPPLTRMCLGGYFFRSLLLVADVMFHIPCIFMHSTWWNHSEACFLHLWSISHFLSPSLICPPSPLKSLFLSWQLKFFPSYLLLPPQPLWWRVSSFSWYHWRRTPLTTSVLEKFSHNPWTSGQEVFITSSFHSQTLPLPSCFEAIIFDYPHSFPAYIRHMPVLCLLHPSKTWGADPESSPSALILSGCNIQHLHPPNLLIFNKHLFHLSSITHLHGYTWDLAKTWNLLQSLSKFKHLNHFNLWC